MTLIDLPVVTQVPGAAVHETHSGIVFLIGDHAYKIKKPVDLGFLDFRTVEQRTRACRREIELNRRLAPDVYLDLATLNGSNALIGPGESVGEPVIVMRRMPADLRLSSLLAAGCDVVDPLRAVARLMADFHSRADRGPAISRAAGPGGLAERWTANLDETEKYRGTVLDADIHRRIRHLALRFVDGCAPLLTQRAEAGYAVDGHGDLLAEDIFCLPDGPRVLDCLDFDDRLRWVDVLDDVAFLAMDLERLSRPELAAQLFASYAEFSGVPSVPSLEHHYVAYRAFVRAKVSCLRAAQGGDGAAADADGFARLALAHLEAGEARLVLVGGAPGTGKSTVAGELADRVNAVVISSDAVRVEERQPIAVRYGAEAKDATYRELLRRAQCALEHGEWVIADATWGDVAWRRAAEDVAVLTGARLVCLECQAPVDVAAHRAQTRLNASRGRSEAATSRSEAGAAVAVALAAHRDPWPDAIALDTSDDAPGPIEAALPSVA